MTPSPAGPELAFFGSISASLSHELNNVLAIVNQLSGLLADLVVGASADHPLDPQRVRNVIGRIDTQVERGRGLVLQLSRFAHSVDDARKSPDARETVERIAGLCRRFATLRKVQLEVRLPAAPIALSGSAFDLQHLVFRCLDLALDISPPGTSLALSLEPADQGVQMLLEGPPLAAESPSPAAKLAFATRLAGELGGRLQAIAEQDQNLRLELFLPASPPLR